MKTQYKSPIIKNHEIKKKKKKPTGIPFKGYVAS